MPRTLFQPVFEKDGLLAAIDVLQFDDATGEYAIHEIKSSTRIEEDISMTWRSRWYFFERMGGR